MFEEVIAFAEVKKEVGRRFRGSSDFSDTFKCSRFQAVFQVKQFRTKTLVETLLCKKVSFWLSKMFR